MILYKEKGPPQLYLQLIKRGEMHSQAIKSRILGDIFRKYILNQRLEERIKLEYIHRLWDTL